MAPKKDAAVKPEGKPAEKPAGKPTEKPEAKLTPEAKQEAAPGPNVVLTPKVKLYWIAIVVLIVLSIAAIIAMTYMYMVVKSMKTPYDEPFQVLRNSLAITLGRPDVQKSGPPQVATLVEDLPSTIQGAHDEFNVKKQKYQDLLHKATRTFSGPWKLHGRNLYYFSKGEKNWYDAENFCISRDAHLASVLDKEEQNFITSQLLQSSWIGLTIKSKDGAWGWSDGSRLVTPYWSGGKPRNVEVLGESSQDCAMMVPLIPSQNWIAESCHKVYSWICKENLDYDEP